MSLNIFPLPLNTPIVEESRSTLFGKAFTITRPWAEAFRARDERLQSASHTDQYVALTTNQTAGVAATALISAANVAKYRISSYLQQTMAAGVSASLQLIIRWTSGGINFAKSGTVLTTNTTSTYEAMPSFMVRVDAGTNITFELVYASNPAAQAAYILDVVAEAVG